MPSVDVLVLFSCDTNVTSMFSHFYISHFLCSTMLNGLLFVGMIVFMYCCFSVCHLIVSSAPPLAPTNLTASDVTEDSVTLTWSPATSQPEVPTDSYIIQIQDASGKTLDTVEIPGTEQRCCAKSLTPDSSYLFAIQARNEAGLSSGSSLTSPVKTKPALGMYLLHDCIQ